MNLDSPETWRWIWAVFATAAALGELATPSAFFFLPFAIGGAAAAVLAVLGVPVPLEWVGFVGVSAASFAILWPMGRKLADSDSEQEGIGATRLVGQEAIVTSDIGIHEPGLVRMDREEWRAESMAGTPVPAGTEVIITSVEGLRLTVMPIGDPFTSGMGGLGGLSAPAPPPQGPQDRGHRDEQDTEGTT